MNVKPLLNPIQPIIRLILPIVIVLVSTTCFSASVNIQWEANDPSPEGYRVFVRERGQDYDYTQPDWEGPATAGMVVNLYRETDYCFVVRAFDGSLEGEDSDEVCYTPPAAEDVLDADRDGMPDNWETAVGLDPLFDDTDGDLDQDGISNRDEYRAGLEPDDPGEGVAPETPELLFPVLDSLVDVDPILSTGAYSDVDGDAHIATQWQIFEQSTGDCRLDVISDRRLTQLNLPHLLLTNNTDYAWRVRYFDSGGKVSQWSDSGYFQTQASEIDLDGNGAPDDQENTSGLDLNADGAPDAHQPDVIRSLSSPDIDCDPTGLSVPVEDRAAEIDGLALVDPLALDEDENTPERLPEGMVAYRLILQEPGQWAQATIHLSTPAPAGSQWVRYDEITGWQDCSAYAVFATDRQSVTIDVKDGGEGDADGTANGIIVGMSGLVAKQISSTLDTGASSGAGNAGGGGGGCFINSMGAPDQPAVSGRGWWHWLKTKADRLMALVNP
jgi:chitinase